MTTEWFRYLDRALDAVEKDPEKAGVTRAQISACAIALLYDCYLQNAPLPVSGIALLGRLLEAKLESSRDFSGTVARSRRGAVAAALPRPLRERQEETPEDRRIRNRWEGYLIHYVGRTEGERLEQARTSAHAIDQHLLLPLWQRYGSTNVIAFDRAGKDGLMIVTPEGITEYALPSLEPDDLARLAAAILEKE